MLPLFSVRKLMYALLALELSLARQLPSEQVISSVLISLWEAQWRLVFDAIPFVSTTVIHSCQRGISVPLEEKQL